MVPERLPVVGALLAFSFSFSLAGIPEMRASKQLGVSVSFAASGPVLLTFGVWGTIASDNSLSLARDRQPLRKNLQMLFQGALLHAMWSPGRSREHVRS